MISPIEIGNSLSTLDLITKLSIFAVNNLKFPKLCHSGKKNSYMKDHMKKFLTQTKHNTTIFTDMQKRFPTEFQMDIENGVNITGDVCCVHRHPANENPPTGN